VTVPEAAALKEVLATVQLFIHAAGDGQTRLCEALLDDEPPACAGTALILQAFHSEELGSLAAGVDAPGGSVLWSRRPLTLTGELVSGVLVVPS
jgi:hypothetical protein